MLKRAHWPILMLTLALAGCGGGGGGGGGTPAPTTSTSSNTSNVITIAPGAGPAGGTSTSSGTSSGSATATGQPINVNGLSYPQGVAVYGSTLYVANTSGASISAIALDQPNYPITTITLQYDPGVPKLTQPTGLAVSSNGPTITLYAANWTDPNSAGGGFIDAITLTPGSSTATVSALVTSGLANPDGLALSADGSSLFVANHGSFDDVTQVSTADGRLIHTYLTGGRYPYSVYADSSNLYATALDNTTHKNVVLSWPPASASAPAVVTSAIPGAGGITGASGSLYVADYAAQTISKVDPNTGTVLSTVSVSGYQPSMLAHDSTRIFFTDSNNGSVNSIPMQ